MFRTLHAKSAFPGIARPVFPADVPILYNRLILSRIFCPFSRGRCVYAGGSAPRTASYVKKIFWRKIFFEMPCSSPHNYTISPVRALDFILQSRKTPDITSISTKTIITAWRFRATAFYPSSFSIVPMMRFQQGCAIFYFVPLALHDEG